MSTIDVIVEEIGEAYAIYLLKKALKEQSRGFDTVEDDGSPGFYSYSGYDECEFDDDYDCDW